MADGPYRDGVESTPGWTRVVATCPSARADLVADVLWSFGPAAIEEQTNGSETVLLAGFVDAIASDAAAAAVRSLGGCKVDVVPVIDDGLDGWREWATVEQAEPFVLVPTWLDTPEIHPGQLLVRLDPGRTFGSGSHPTTRAVLMALATLVGPDTTVLDVGCGSGVLAVGAALLGAAAVVGIDVDAESPSIVATNATTNGVADLVTASTDPLSTLAGRADRYDVVAANLLAPVIVELAADLQTVVAAGGTLILSGLLADRWQATVDPFIDGSSDGRPVWALDDVVLLDGWAAIVLRRR